MLIAARLAMAVQSAFTDSRTDPHGREVSSLDDLIPRVYDELKRIARNRLRAKPTGHSLDTTGLVHEAYLRLADQKRIELGDRNEFFAAAAVAMRRILVDHARRRLAIKRGGGYRRVKLEGARSTAVTPDVVTLVAVDQALEQVAALEPRLAHVVECRFFAGLTEAETAATLGVTPRTVRRDWVKARGLLHVALSVE